ncbi:MAG: uroporphyrinogen-III synthase [Acidobacteriota bacterium]
MGAAKRSSLADRKVLVARAPSKARAWVEALEARGAVVAAREIFMLESMLGEARVQRSIDLIDTWDWILLTSQQGLRFLVRGLQARSVQLAGLRGKFGVVGPQTATALEVLGKTPAAVAEPSNAMGLAAVLEGKVADGEQILIVRPEHGRSGLAERLEEFGAEVSSVPYYRNRPAGNLAAVAAELSEGSFEAAVFGAPSSFSHLFAACGDRATEGFERIVLVAIGGTTAEAIRDHGCEVAAVASEPTPAGIADAVEAALARR